MQYELKNTFDKVYLTREYDTRHNWYYNNWIGYITVEQVIEGASFYLQKLRETPSPKLLNDNRQLVGSWTAANDWIAQEWEPHAITAGLKWFALVVSPGTFAQLSAEAMSQRLSLGIETRVFEDIDQAKKWLHSH